MLNALLAVTRVYWYGFKSLESVQRRLPIAPADLLGRIRRAYQVESVERESLLAALVEDAYDLVERHVPGVDVERLRAIFRHRRSLWEGEQPELP